jgi:hypothetical protein
MPTGQVEKRKRGQRAQREEPFDSAGIVEHKASDALKMCLPRSAFRWRPRIAPVVNHPCQLRAQFPVESCAE